MRFPLNAAAVAVIGVSLAAVCSGQASAGPDPCEPGGARYGTKDCPPPKKPVKRPSGSAVGELAASKSSASSARASSGSAAAQKHKSDTVVKTAAKKKQSKKAPVAEAKTKDK